MNPRLLVATVLVFSAAVLSASVASAQIGRRFPSEKKIISDPVTGVPLSFLTSTPAGDSKIYPTHPQWTADGKWVIFRGNRVPGQALAVNEATGDIVQVTDSGFTGMLCVAQKSMRLFFTRPANREADAPAQPTPGGGAASEPSSPAGRGAGRGPRGPVQIVAIDLARVFADSAAGQMQSAAIYETVCGVIPTELGVGGDLALDATEEVAYFRLSREAAAKALPPGAKAEATYGPRNMGAGPAGIGSMNLKTGECKVVAAVPFQVGHVQTNPWVPGEIIFCWETGGKAPQRAWTVLADGTGLRPLFPESVFDWVTHEAVVTKDEVAVAILGHRKVGVNDTWGTAGTREHPTGLAIVNLRTRELQIAGQTKSGSGLWHVHASPDGRWATGDDFARNLYLIDRRTNEMMLLTAGHKSTAADHPHPTFSADSTRIEIQSAMLSEDGRSMNICIVPVPAAWLKRTYDDKVHPAK
jgi:oligogalacturonide lyase